MPSTYAHYSFSRRVLEKLPKPLAHICKSFETQFQFGSQGPDFLYFYHPTVKNHYTEIGALIHCCSLNRFLRQVLPILKLYGTDSKEYAYMLGFICHFALDSYCHPYVIPKVKELAFPHIAMETEFDRLLMIQDYEDPFRYPLQQLIPQDDKTLSCLHHLYPDVPEDVIATCMKTYHFYRKLWVTPNKLDYNLTKAFLKIRRRSGYFCNFLLSEKVHPLAKITNPKLMELYEEALDAAVSYLVSFHESFTEGKPLDERFERNFKA